ncbi:MFS transporter, PHS family, inorganic phosphate transporter [Galdieria sulphuraria]|uniref:MFS transporter, PHS family, inorganic phosphate transporter n=1 Tax=Galdieria sulphuraria TaxID=130081 RepID=M2Y734_GALSU|nr:MFS transporter, PHS family, inorganic phosphate transporter [Galdieria sulphuraria]EME31659.1 MFS transporter, PHS family, inorganic phosphate transporter [Galdieria sulphuraria]|eukprot:XP_005708179.1 MFS transporter, PHS family, inorganic phosphate transporter [Galdieria sulphuraria]
MSFEVGVTKPLLLATGKMPAAQDIQVIPDENFDSREKSKSLELTAGFDKELQVSEPLSNKERRSAILNIVFAGIALTSDGYCESVVNLINVFFSALYPIQFTSAMSTRISNALLVGAIIGQLGFGLISDRIGRKVGLLCTTAFVIVGSLLCSAAYGAGGSVEGLLWALVVYRGIVGVGVGGEYPCSSANASEATEETIPRSRGGVFIMVTNFALVIGGVLSIIVQVVLLKIFGTNDLEPVWRISFGLAIVPILSVFYFRIRMLNSKLYRKEAMKKKVPYILILRKYWKYLIGTCGTWFLYDFVAFSNGVFSSTILENVISGTDIMKTAYFQLILSALGIPGLVIGALTIDKIGRKKQQFIGFLGYGVMGILIGALFGKLRKYTAALIILYGVFNSFGNFGPGDALGLVSSEIYPTAVRGTCYGISAAFGKAGGAIGTQVFLPIRNAFGGASSTNGNRAVFIVCGGVSLLGALLSLIFIPDYSKRYLKAGDEEFHEYLKDNNIHALQGESLEASASSNMLHRT